MWQGFIALYRSVPSHSNTWSKLWWENCVFCCVLSAVMDCGCWPAVGSFISVVVTQSECSSLFVPGVCAALSWPTAREGQGTKAHSQAPGAPQHVPCGCNLVWDLHDWQKSSTGRIFAYLLLKKKKIAVIIHTDVGVLTFNPWASCSCLETSYKEPSSKCTLSPGWGMLFMSLICQFSFWPFHTLRFFLNSSGQIFKSVLEFSKL